MGGAESLGISKVGSNSVVSLMESLIGHWSASSVGVGPRKETVISASLDAIQLSFPLHTTGDPEAITLSLEHRGSESV